MWSDRPSVSFSWLPNPIAFSLILLIQLSGHAGLLDVGNNLPVSTIYFSLSIGLNAVVTLLIIGRILYYAQMTTINQSKLPKRYISVLAMLVESAALSAVTGIVLIVTLHTNVASSIGVEALYGVVTVCVNVNFTVWISSACRLCHQPLSPIESRQVTLGPETRRNRQLSGLLLQLLKLEAVLFWEAIVKILFWSLGMVAPNLATFILKITRLGKFRVLL